MFIFRYFFLSVHVNVTTLYRIAREKVLLFKQLKHLLMIVFDSLLNLCLHAPINK